MLLKTLSEKIGRYTLVLLLLLIALIIAPLFEDLPFGRILLNGWCMLVTALLVLSLISESKHRNLTIILGSSLFGCLLIYSLGQLLHKELSGVGLAAFGLIVVFISHCIWIVLSSIYRRKLFTADLISGAILSYLLLGIAWGVLNTLIELISPGAFSFSSEFDIDNKGSALIYHSFITLTTLGYGEILPLNRASRTSSYLEAVTGVMYCAILVAGLIGNIHKKKQQ